MPEFTGLEVIRRGETVRVNCPRLDSELVQELLGVGCHSVSWGPDSVSFVLGAEDLERFREIYERGGHAAIDLPFLVLAYYDFISPFAYVATELVKPVEAEFNVYVEWRAFELRPRWRQYPDVTANAARSQARWAMQKDAARRYGLPIAEDRPPFRLRTRPALMAAEYARERGRFREFQRAMFNAYYVTHEDIRNLSVIAGIAEGLGLDGRELTARGDGAPLRAPDRAVAPRGAGGPRLRGADVQDRPNDHLGTGAHRGHTKGAGGGGRIQETGLAA